MEFLIENTYKANIQKWFVLEFICNSSKNTYIYKVISLKTKITGIMKLSSIDDGELFREFHFLKKNQKSKIIPRLFDFGTCDIKGNQYRFIIIEKFQYSLKDLMLTNVQINTIIENLKYIHNLGYIHLNIKPDNILLSNHKDPYIIDFGSVIYVHNPSNRKNNNKHFGNKYYSSVEIYEGKFSFKADLESFGYVLLELFGYNLPWRKFKQQNKIYETKKMFLDFQIKHNLINFISIKENNIISYFKNLTKIKNDVINYEDFKFL